MSEYERTMFLDKITQLERDIKNLKKENVQLKTILSQNPNNNIVVDKKDLQIIIDRLGRQYMTEEALQIAKKFAYQIKNI